MYIECQQFHLSPKCQIVLPRHPIRFGTRTLLLFVAVIAVGLVLYLDWRNLQAAYDKYDSMLGHWEAGREGIDDIFQHSKSLMHTESNSIWISRRQAKEQHIARLNEFIYAADNR